MHDWPKMKKVIILIPIFNDWQSFKKLIFEIDKSIDGLKGFIFDCLLINDASTIEQPFFKKPKNFNSFKILNMKENMGHARCNAFGIRYVCKKENFDNIILMDGDGEDRPIEIVSLIKKISENPKNSVVAKRIKRSEGPFFQFLYFLHKMITLIFTGKKINFGNYSCLTKSDAEKISSKASLWSSYSGTVKKYIGNLDSIDSIRGVRYFGPSKMSLFNLIIHSFSIIAVFKYNVFLRSIIIILPIIFFSQHLGLISFLLVLSLITFIISIFLVSSREKKEELLNSQDNLMNVKDITH